MERPNSQKEMSTFGKRWHIIVIAVLVVTSTLPLISPGRTTTGVPSDSVSSGTITRPGHENISPAFMNPENSTWWNPGWHYRRMYNISGTGNISIQVNFSAWLQSLQVPGKTMENSTITIVQYTRNGSMEIVVIYEFKENHTFNNQTNANGVLTWSISTPGSYGVYFDVTENRGYRSHLNETANLKKTGDTNITFNGTVQGWQTSLSAPLATYYLPNQQVTILVKTSAKAEDVTACFYRDGSFEFSSRFQSINYLQWHCQTAFLQRGNWTVNISSHDDAEYHATNLTTEFFVGNPDLAITKLDLNSAPYYRGKTLTVRAHIYCYNATLSPVTLSLTVNDELYAVQSALTFQKNSNTSVNFYWTPLKKETDILTVTLDVNNTIPESNEQNNEKTLIAQIQGVPELGVVNITVPSHAIIEGESATISARIINRGDENAENYRVNLYLEQTNTNSTTLGTEKSSAYVNIEMNQTVTINLVWNQVRYGGDQYNGRWVVGVKILFNDSKPDAKWVNNTLIRYDTRLRVAPGERTPPVITPVDIPSAEQQGNPVPFLVEVTDESGIASVNIAVKDPANKYHNGSMTLLENNQYQYVLTDAHSLGTYTYSITATDMAFTNNKRTLSGYFQIIPDATPPTIAYYGANPFAQLKDSPIEIKCIASDYSGISSVTVTITYPDAHTDMETLNNALNDTKYTCSSSYSQLGEYSFTITARDTLGNEITTLPQGFWVTRDLNDTDGDGMPDTWERTYGFNPYDPHDATQDADADGILNSEEYTIGSNPTLASVTSSGVLQRLLDNWIYLLGSLLACIVILSLAFYGLRRRKQ